MRDSCLVHMRVQQTKSDKQQNESMRKQIIVKEKFKNEEERPTRLKTQKRDIGKKQGNPVG